MDYHWDYRVHFSGADLAVDGVKEKANPKSISHPHLRIVRPDSWPGFEKNRDPKLFALRPV
jgi:hypothetical protein